MTSWLAWFVSLAALMATALAGSVSPTEPAKTGPAMINHCDTVSGSYYLRAVVWAREAGIAKGLDENYFAPDQPVTRGQLVTLLYRYATWAKGTAPPATTTNPFHDVTPGSYYETPINWATENNISLGINPATFQPNAPTTRAQTAAFLHRYNGTPTTQYNPAFTDITPTDWHAQPISWLTNQAITTGTTSTQFSPNQPSTRAQVVTFLWRMAGTPTPTQQPTPRHCHDTFTAIGDSVMLGALLLGDLTPTSVPHWHGTIEAAVCRQSVVDAASCSQDFVPSTLTVIRESISAGTMGDVLVIHAGSNDMMTPEAFDQLVEAAAGVETIWFMNVQNRRSWEGQGNAAIAEGVQRWAHRREIGLLDWHDTTERSPGLVKAADGTHVTEEGGAAYAALIESALQP